MMKIKIQSTKGAASIPLVMGVGILLFLIVISIASVETARIYLVQANLDGTQAFEYTEAGVRDALENITRDNTFGSTTITYKIEMATSGCVTYKSCIKVAVSPTISTSTTGRIIGSIGYYKSAVRGLETTILFDPDDFGRISIESTKETLSPFGL